MAWESRGKSARPELSTSRKTPHVEAFRETKSDQLGAVFRFAATWPSTAIRCTKSDVGRRWNWDRDTYVLIGDAGPSLHGQPRWSRHRTHSRLGPLPCRECLVRVQRAVGWPSAACGQRAVALFEVVIRDCLHACGCQHRALKLCRYRGTSGRDRSRTPSRKRWTVACSSSTGCRRRRNHTDGMGRRAFRAEETGH